MLFSSAFNCSIGITEDYGICIYFDIRYVASGHLQVAISCIKPRNLTGYSSVIRWPVTSERCGAWRLFTLCKMADAPGSRFLVIVLLCATGVMVYYYWDASSSSTALYVEMEHLTRQWTVANRTIATLRYQLDDCKAQVPLNIQLVTDRLCYRSHGQISTSWQSFRTTHIMLAVISGHDYVECLWLFSPWWS